MYSVGVIVIAKNHLINYNIDYCSRSMQKIAKCLNIQFVNIKMFNMKFPLNYQNRYIFAYELLRVSHCQWDTVT